MSQFTKIDELLLPDHSALTKNDNCYFYGEYTARAGYAASPTNNLISNFKREVKYKNTNAWQYKIQAIKNVAKMICSSLDWDRMDNIYWQHIPSSKSKSDPEYDDRFEQLFDEMSRIAPTNFNRLDCLQTITSNVADHISGNRTSIEDLVTNIQFIPPPPNVIPRQIMILDDIITNGNHYKATQNVLSSYFRDCYFTGMFIARTVHLQVQLDFSDLY